VVVKSTVVPGTTENMVKPIIEKHSGKRCGIGFGLCMNPEFLREGAALYDTLHPDRIIIGEYDKKSGDVFENLFTQFYKEELPPIIRTNPSTAELIKYANNAFLATKISFINTIANVCEKIPGADVTTVAEGIGLDERIGSLFLRAGLGYGGSCFPKDVKALIAFSKSLGYEPTLIKTVKEVNNVQPYKAVELAEKLVGDLKGKRIAILGLAFKPGTEDMREATSIKVVDRLLKKKARVIVYDPVAMDNAKKIFGEKVSYSSSAIECIRNAVCCIIVTEWDEFRNLGPEDFVKHMKEPNVVDGRRIYEPRRFGERNHFTAVGLG
jgi:UDPglucose 6-dehydrogenase